VDFTREPIIETVITPREGCKLVVRSSKSSGQEEYFVDALEVVSFGSSFFFRSQERPKSFLVPTTDYEVLEVREPRMALKNVGQERKIKIAGGREAAPKKEPQLVKEEKEEKKDPQQPQQQTDKKRDRKRGRRRGRGSERGVDGEGSSRTDDAVDLPAPDVSSEETIEVIRTTASFVSSLLPPPPTLISEQIQRYKQDDLYKEAFYQERRPSTPPPVIESPEISDQPAEQPSEALHEEQHVTLVEDDKVE